MDPTTQSINLKRSLVTQAAIWIIAYVFIQLFQYIFFSLNSQETLPNIILTLINTFLSFLNIIPFSHSKNDFHPKVLLNNMPLSWQMLRKLPIFRWYLFCIFQPYRNHLSIDFHAWKSSITYWFWKGQFWLLK